MRQCIVGRFYVSEIFGPTIQGEGRYVGVPCYFIRFGGCDYRCSWCDSPHAVLPHLFRQAERLTPEEMIHKVESLPGAAEWIVLSGGNPALFNLTDLVQLAHWRGFQLMIETQGTMWQPWIADLDDICVSPKPPSSGNCTPASATERFLQYLEESKRVYLKIPVLTDEDYIFAVDRRLRFPEYPMFLSIVNTTPRMPTVASNGEGDPNAPVDRHLLLHRTRLFMERVAQDPDMANVRVFPQQHVLVWGNERGR